MTAPANLFEQQASNRRRSFWLVTGFVLFFAWVGFGGDIAWYLMSTGPGMANRQGYAPHTVPFIGIITTLIAGAVCWYSWKKGAERVLWSTGAREILEPQTDGERRLVNVVEEMAIASGLPKPRIFVVPDADPNAFATGIEPTRACIAVTEGLLGALSREELQAVVAHEMAHVQNFDTRLMTLLAAMVGSIALMSDGMGRMLRYGSFGGGSSGRSEGRSNDKGGNPLALVILVLWVITLILAPLISRFLAMAVSRKREYLADATGAQLTRNPLALASALEKLDAAAEPTHAITKGAAHLCIVDPSASQLSQKEGFLGDVFSSHPPIRMRIARLKGMAYQQVKLESAGVNGRGWLVVLGVFLLAAFGGAGIVLGTRAVLRRRLRRWARTALWQFRARTDRYKLVERDRIREALLQDPQVEAAIARYAELHGTAESQVRIRVNQYVDEIVPFFNVLSYYKLGYNLSRLLINLLYKSSIEYRDHEALDRIPRRDVVVYLMNHRSNADYVVVAYVLARVVSISYAVGEWARTWPLEFVFKSFGSYFIRRQYREPLYHVVLERYVQLITRNGVTQGIFPEGGLTRDGALRPVKIGLLDYIIRTVDDPAFDRDIWLVPVGINYDRVLEDRSLIRERIVGGRRSSRLTQLGNVVSYLGWNTVRLFTGQLKRYGRVAIAFGTPISVRGWLADQPAGILALPKEERLPHVQRLAEQALERIGAVIPVTPVPLASAALLSFGASVVSRSRLLERLDELRDRLGEFNARIVRTELPVSEVWDRAWLMFAMRRLVVAHGDDLVILPSARPLLEYYANSIRHLLPAEMVVAYSPASEGDATLPRLATRGEMDIMTTELPVLKKRR